MSYIYKITNSLNQKSYIGKTLFSIEKRFKDHLKEAIRERAKNRPLYNAINKYGESNFSIELIEEVADDILNEREKYWIEFYQTFKNGYNATTGGDGKQYLDHDLVSLYYIELQNANEVAKKLNISKGYVLQILKEKGIEILPSGTATRNKYGKSVRMFDLENNFQQVFITLKDAGRFIIEENQTNFQKTLLNLGGITSHISQCANKKRKTAYGHRWEFTS